STGGIEDQSTVVPFGSLTIEQGDIEISYELDVGQNKKGEIIYTVLVSVGKKAKTNKLYEEVEDDNDIKVSATGGVSVSLSKIPKSQPAFCTGFVHDPGCATQPVLPTDPGPILQGSQPKQQGGLGSCTWELVWTAGDFLPHMECTYKF